MVTLHEVITFLVSMQISISSLQTHNVNRCGRSRHLARKHNTTGYIDHAAFLGTINPDTNKIPKHLFQGYLNIYNNYFKAPWMPDRTEANPNELNQDDARYGFRCCHLKNIWTAPLPPET